MQPIDPAVIETIIVSCAEKHLVPYFKKLTDDQIHQKTSPQDVATQADIETEENLIKHLKEAYPHAFCIGEESFDPNDVTVLKAPALFVIDPLDGTNAFRNERPGFAVMVSFIQNGTLTHVWIHAPLLQETLFAEKGKGVFLNGKQTEFRKKYVAPSVATGHFSLQHRQEMQDFGKALEAHGLVFAPHAHACTDFLRFVKGEVDVIAYQNCYPWDILPGVLIAHEMGGYAATLYDENDLMTERFADIHQPTLYTHRKEDWSIMAKIAP